MTYHAQSHFHEKGYLYIPQLIPGTLVTQLLKAVKEAVYDCALDLGISPEEYLSVVSRWRDPSPVTQVVPPYVLHHIQGCLQDLFGLDFVLDRFNVICKTPYCYDPVPCHQDISYSPNDPYFCSVWLALNPAPPESGPIQVLPKSHLYPIKPAVDFWHLDFIDTIRFSKGWQRYATTFHFNPGDSLIFDSRLWHGSEENKLRQDRFTLVSRWRYQGFIPPAIPPLPVRPFGMWTWGPLTLEILRDNYHYLVGRQPQAESAALVEEWINLLEHDTLLSVPKGPAISTLRQLHILNQACAQHNGGDAIGKIYKDLWHSLLRHLRTP